MVYSRNSDIIVVCEYITYIWEWNFTDSVTIYRRDRLDNKRGGEV